MKHKWERLVQKPLTFGQSLAAAMGAPLWKCNRCGEERSCKHKPQMGDCDFNIIRQVMES